MAAGRLVHRIRHTLLRRFKSKEPILFCLPSKILSQIFSHLPLPSQVCLALSCKDMYYLFSPVFKAKELQFPRMPRMPFNDKLSSLRVRTLLQLENSRWAFCAACQKLHPKNEFSGHQLWNVSPWQRMCRLWSGIVDLCPCIAITPRDRTHIVEYLMGKRQSLDLVEKGLLQDGEQCILLHKCNAYSAVQVDIKFSLAEDDKLIASVQCKMPYSALNQNVESARFCCGQDLRYWLSIRLRFQSVADCPLCYTRGVKIKDPNTPELFSAHATRDLGRGIYPTDVIRYDDQWLRQQRSPRRSYT